MGNGMVNMGPGSNFSFQNFRKKALGIKTGSQGWARLNKRGISGLVLDKINSRKRDISINDYSAGEIKRDIESIKKLKKLDAQDKKALEGVLTPLSLKRQGSKERALENKKNTGLFSGFFYKKPVNTKMQRDMSALDELNIGEDAKRNSFAVISGGLSRPVSANKPSTGFASAKQSNPFAKNAGNKGPFAGSGSGAASIGSAGTASKPSSPHVNPLRPL